jgi:membrane associated rhomboid family serine protease
VRQRERILNLPEVVTVLLGAMVTVQLFVYLGPRTLVVAFFETFAFIPLRLSYALAPARVLEALGPEAAQDIVAGDPLVWATPVTYAFLHGGWTHLAINALTFAAFGSPVARRLGAKVFLGFFLCCAVAGAATHFVLHPYDATPVVGASAAISGTMAAIVRFAFSPGARLGDYGAGDGRDAQTAPLSRLGENRQAVFFLIVWFGANFFFGAFPAAAGSSEPIAWEAHLGGFLFGLLAFGAFDHWARRN